MKTVWLIAHVNGRADETILADRSPDAVVVALSPRASYALASLGVEHRSIDAYDVPRTWSELNRATDALLESVFRAASEGNGDQWLLPFYDLWSNEIVQDLNREYYVATCVKKVLEAEGAQCCKVLIDRSDVETLQRYRFVGAFFKTRNVSVEVCGDR